MRPSNPPRTLTLVVGGTECRYHIPPLSRYRRKRGGGGGGWWALANAHHRICESGRAATTTTSTIVIVNVIGEGAERIIN